MITAAALVALVALVVRHNSLPAAGGQSGGRDESRGTLAAEDPGARGSADPGEDNQDPAGGSAVRAPDISAMSPRERADRLYDRVMRLAEEGKQDSVAFFAPMVLAAYQMLGPLDADSHYDLGRIAEVSGAGPLARAEADSILRTQPTHLLGLALAARVAVDQHRQADAKSYYRRFLAAAPAERSKNLPEYQRHRNDIAEALAEAKKMGSAS